MQFTSLYINTNHEIILLATELALQNVSFVLNSIQHQFYLTPFNLVSVINSAMWALCCPSPLAGKEMETKKDHIEMETKKDQLVLVGQGFKFMSNSRVFLKTSTLTCLY